MLMGNGVGECSTWNTSVLVRVDPIGKARTMAKTKLPRLGRGLSSLISSSSSTSQAGGARQGEGRYEPMAPDGPTNDEIAVDQISPNPFQPRHRFDEDALTDLAASISQQGILQPLVIARATSEDADRPYMLIAGERRLRAAQQAGLDTVPCVVRTPSRQQVLEWALVENIQRRDLNTMERAAAYREYIDRFELTQAEAAERLGQARTTVTNRAMSKRRCAAGSGRLRSMLAVITAPSRSRKKVR